MTAPPKVEIFKRMSFFLDLKDYANVATLSNDIHYLGGTIEPFLCRDVKYVITNRPSMKQLASEKGNHPNSSSSLSTISSRSFSPVTMSLHSSSSNQDSSKFRQKNPMSSRAALLLERAIQANAATNEPRDVLQLARQWGSKIVHVTVLIDWIKKLKSKHPSLSTVNKETNIADENQRSKLVTPFLKFEDNESQYLPQFRQLKSWPVLQFGSEDAGKANGDGACAVEKLAAVDQLTKKSFPKNPIRKDAPCAVRDHQLAGKLKTAPVKQAGRKPGFCEICSENYMNIYEHIGTADHKKFVADESNFAILDAAISELPSFEDYRRNLISHSNDLLHTPNQVEEESTMSAADTILKRIKRKLCLHEFDFVQPPNKKMPSIINDINQQKSLSDKLSISGEQRFPLRDLNNWRISDSRKRSPSTKLLDANNFGNGIENTSPSTRMLRSTAIKRKTSSAASPVSSPSSSSTTFTRQQPQSSPNYFLMSQMASAFQFDKPRAAVADVSRKDDNQVPEVDAFPRDCLRRQFTAPSSTVVAEQQQQIWYAPEGLFLGISPIASITNPNVNVRPIDTALVGAKYTNNGEQQLIDCSLIEQMPSEVINCRGEAFAEIDIRDGAEWTAASKEENYHQEKTFLNSSTMTDRCPYEAIVSDCVP